MQCTEFETLWAALEDDGVLSAAMEDHRRACPRCAHLVDDLVSITTHARRLQLQEEPPARVWVGLRNQLEQEGLIREPVAAVWQPRWRTSPATAWLFRLPMGLAYAAVFFLAVGAMYLHSILSTPAAPPLVVTAPQVPPVVVAQETAETDADVQALLQKMPEEHRSTFVATWNQVNSSIENLSNFVQTHPDDPFALYQLQNAFQQKERLRETLARWEEF
ncbi:MAG TPA: hypothetical protein VNN17_04075 [Terriglobia bacterium]|nr:hypothetical protein [Terriglobia bacterium]